MDEEEALFIFSKDKAVGVLTAANQLIVFSIVSVITVFIPLTYTMTNKTKELVDMFSILIILSAPMLLLLLLFYIIKYREYKQKCHHILVMSLKNKILNRHPKTRFKVRDVALEIEKTTSLPYTEIVVDLVDSGM